MMLKLPTIDIKHSSETEAKRVLFSCSNMVYHWKHKSISPYYYLTQGFIILPYLPKFAPPNTIHIPDVDYSSIPDFWNSLSKLSPRIPYNAFKDIRQNLIPLVPYNDEVLDGVSSRIRDSIDSYFVKFWQFMSHMLPVTSVVDRIVVYPTMYGSIGSVRSIKVYKYPQTIYLYIRKDARDVKLFKLIALSLVRHSLESFNISWKDIIKIIEFIFRDTYLSDVGFGGEKTLVESITRKQRNRLYYESRNFIAKLNLPKIQLNINFSVKNNKIYFKKQVVRNLGAKEEKLLKLLINNQPDVTLYDQIIESVYNDNPNTSNWQIAKLIQRLRGKLQQHSIDPGVIQSVRGKGYIITN